MGRKKQTIPMLRVETRVKGETFDLLEKIANEQYDGNMHMCLRILIENSLKACDNSERQQKSIQDWGKQISDGFKSINVAVKPSRDA